MTDARDASLHWVARHLAAALPDEPASEIEGRAEVLVTIAEQYSMPMDLLIAWIDVKAPAKEWTGSEWRRWCERQREAEILARQLQRDRERS